MTDATPRPADRPAIDTSADELSAEEISEQKAVRLSKRDRLIELGCTALQGWLFSPAVSAEEALAMMPRIVLTDHVQTFQRVPR